MNSLTKILDHGACRSFNCKLSSELEDNICHSQLTAIPF